MIPQNYFIDIYKFTIYPKGLQSPFGPFCNASFLLVPSFWEKKLDWQFKMTVKNLNLLFYYVCVVVDNNIHVLSRLMLILLGK